MHRLWVCCMWTSLWRSILCCRPLPALTVLRREKISVWLLTIGVCLETWITQWKCTATINLVCPDMIRQTLLTPLQQLQRVRRNWSKRTRHCGISLAMRLLIRITPEPGWHSLTRKIQQRVRHSEKSSMRNWRHFPRWWLWQWATTPCTKASVLIKCRSIRQICCSSRSCVLRWWWYMQKRWISANMRMASEAYWIHLLPPIPLKL